MTYTKSYYFNLVASLRTSLSSENPWYPRINWLSWYNDVFNFFQNGHDGKWISTPFYGVYCYSLWYYYQAFHGRSPAWLQALSVLLQEEQGRSTGAVCRNHRIKRLVPCRARTGTLKNPAKCLWRWEPDRRSYFFFSPPAHLCAVTYMTEISLIVTLNKQFNSTLLYYHQLSFQLAIESFFQCHINEIHSKLKGKPLSLLVYERYDIWKTWNHYTISPFTKP